MILRPAEPVMLLSGLSNQFLALHGKPMPSEGPYPVPSTSGMLSSCTKLIASPAYLFQHPETSAKAKKERKCAKKESLLPHTGVLCSPWLGGSHSVTTRQEPPGVRLFSHLPHFRKQHCLFQHFPWTHSGAQLYPIPEQLRFPSPSSALSSAMD